MLVLIGLVIGVILYLRPEQESAVQVSGYVRCTSGAPVQQVWIDGAGVGLAQTRTDPTGKRTLYSLDVPGFESYSIRVICPGSPASGPVVDTAPTTKHATASYICDDTSAAVQTKPHQGQCVPDNQ